jgi:hypothetical protein
VNKFYSDSKDTTFHLLVFSWSNDMYMPDGTSVTTKFLITNHLTSSVTWIFITWLLKYQKSMLDLDPLLPCLLSIGCSGGRRRTRAEATQNCNHCKHNVRTIHLKQLRCCPSWAQQFTKYRGLKQLQSLLEINRDNPLKGDEVLTVTR